MSRPVLVTLLLIFATVPYRVLPMLFIGGRKFPPFVNSLFYYIPFAVLSALVVPDVLSATGNAHTAFCGALAAFAVSCFTDNSFYAMLLSVIAAYAAFWLGL